MKNNSIVCSAIIVLSVFFSAVGYSQQATPQKNTDSSNLRRSASSENSAEFDRALEEYYELTIAKTGRIKGLIKAYRRETKKSGSEHDYLFTNAFISKVDQAFKKNWKELAGNRLSLQELKYLITFVKSSVNKKASDVDNEATNFQAIIKLIDPLLDNKPGAIKNIPTNVSTDKKSPSQPKR